MVGGTGDSRSGLGDGGPADQGPHRRRAVPGLAFDTAGQPLCRRRRGRPHPAYRVGGHRRAGCSRPAGTAWASSATGRPSTATRVVAAPGLSDVKAVGRRLLPLAGGRERRHGVGLGLEPVYGQLGDGTTIDRPTPTRVAGSPTWSRWPAAPTTASPCGPTARCGPGAGTGSASWATAPPPTAAPRSALPGSPGSRPSPPAASTTWPSPATAPSGRGAGTASASSGPARRPPWRPARCRFRGRPGATAIAAGARPQPGRPLAGRQQRSCGRGAATASASSATAPPSTAACRSGRLA